MLFIFFASVMLLWIGAGDAKGFLKRVLFTFMGGYGLYISIVYFAHSTTHIARMV